MRDDDLTTARILIVDDQPSNVRLLERVLVTAGYEDLMSTLDPREVLERYRTFQPDLIVRTPPRSSARTRRRSFA